MRALDRCYDTDHATDHVVLVVGLGVPDLLYGRDGLEGFVHESKDVP